MYIYTVYELRKFTKVILFVNDLNLKKFPEPRLEKKSDPYPKKDQVLFLYYNIDFFYFLFFLFLDLI